MSEKSVKVEIANGLYSLKIQSSEEENLTKAVELINQKISEFEKNYGIKDKKDVLAMVTLQLVTQLMSEKSKAISELSTLKNVLNDVESMLIQHQKNIQHTKG
jgi:cell division protein ZapA